MPYIALAGQAWIGSIFVSLLVNKEMVMLFRSDHIAIYWS